MRSLGQRLGRIVVIAGGVALGALHIAVLLRRVADGSLLKPLVMAQWLVALGLLAAVGALRRQGVSVFRGRPAAAFWIVVALMHGMVALPGGPGFVGVLNTAPVIDALPVGFGLVVGALAALAGLLALKRRPAPSRFELRRAASDLLPRLRPPRALSARAPPA